MSRESISISRVRSDFTQKIQSYSGEDILACYQCGRCSAGCPIASFMDVLPNQIIRLIQLGIEEDVKESLTPWLCASCFTCYTRCPRGIDFSRIAEAVRQVVLDEGEDRFGPRQIQPDHAAEAPQQGIVSLFRKFSV